MSMKLSRRDKVIFIVVLVAVVIGVGIWLFLKPQYENMQASEDRLAAKQAEKAQLEEKIATLPDLKKTLENKVNDVVKVQEQFLSEKDLPDTYQISQYVMDLLAPSEITITGMKLDLLNPVALREYIYNKRALAYPMKMNGDLAHKLPDEVYYAYTNSYPAEKPAAGISGTNVTVSFECDLEYEQLFNAIQIVADHNKNIYLQNATSSIDIDPEEDKIVAEGEMIITIYEIYPMDPADVDA